MCDLRRFAAGPWPGRLRGAGFGLVLLLSLWGCQCCRCTDHVSCLVDWGIDHAVPFDALYCSKLDLTRINRPGGLQCCCRNCPPVPCCTGQVYAHRWNSPPQPNPDTGLEMTPNLPAPLPGPELRRPALQEEQVPPGSPTPQPLFPMPETPPTEAETPPAQADAGVIQTRYLSESPALLPGFVPTTAVFGN